MNNFYKYLPVASEDRDWGLQILHAGYQEYAPGGAYPDSNHPAHHNFDWQKGRILQEYSLIYITAGKGVYNAELTGNIVVEGGSVIVVFPNERHRYKPSPETGWKEYWLGFEGPVMSNLVDHDFFDPARPVFNIGYNETMINLFMQVIGAIKNEKPGYQPLVCGAAMYMLGLLYSSAKQKLIIHEEDQDIVEHARVLIRSNLFTSIRPIDIAEQLKVSYSRFRKIFKEYTGMAPIQYQIQLKLEKAKEDLVNTTKSIKEIAFDLNFETTQYFSNLFREKTNYTPVEFRKKFRRY